MYAPFASSSAQARRVTFSQTSSPCSPFPAPVESTLTAVHLHPAAHFGTISLNSSIFILPAGVSPSEMSKKTIGLPFVPAPGISVLVDEAMRKRRRMLVVGMEE